MTTTTPMLYAYNSTDITTPLKFINLELTCKRLRFVCRYSSQMPQVTLVSNEHDDDVVVSVITQLFEPPFNILICQMFCYVVYQQRADCPAVVTAHSNRMRSLADYHFTFLPQALVFGAI